jgi:N-glycosylase/DNA lyase
VLIDISCLYGRISYGANTLEKVYIDKKEKYIKLAQETSNIREMHVEIIPIIVSSLGAVHAKSLETLRNLLSCDDKEMKRIGRQLSEAAIMESMETWRRYAREMPCPEDARAIRITTQEIKIANENKPMNKPRKIKKIRNQEADKRI